MTYEAKLEPRVVATSYPWRTYLVREGSGERLAEDIHSSWFFARRRYKKLAKRASILNGEQV